MFDTGSFGYIAPDWVGRLHYHHEVGSTNDEALSLACAGADHGTVVLADHQLSGRGRRGAEWLSKPGDGLLFSLIVRPDYPREFWCRLALATGLAIATCLRDEWQVKAELKWPNDVLIDERKCCGVLVEAREDFAVIGVGLNVAYSPSGEDYTSVWEELGKPVSREELLADVLSAISAETLLCGGSGFADQLRRLREVSVLNGRTISFQSNGKAYRGVFKGIGESGEMLVLMDEGAAFGGGKVRSFLQAEMVRF